MIFGNTVTKALYQQGPSQLDEMKEALEVARTAVSGLQDWLWQNVVAHDVVPMEMPAEVSDLLDRCIRALDSVRSRVVHMQDELRRPLPAFLSGYALARDEYYLLCALGVFEQGATKALGLCNVDDYEAFSFFHYEDEKHRCYMKSRRSTKCASGVN